MDFEGRVALVTGGGKGIGRQIAADFASRGAAVVVVGREEEPLQEFARGVEASGGKAAGYSVDLVEADKVNTMVENATRVFGRIDIVVTVAGHRDHAESTFADADIAHYENVVHRNLMSTANPIRAALPGMIERKYGKIVAISGVHGFRGGARHTPLVSAKWAIGGFVRSLALEAGQHNVNANIVSPGYVQGPRSTAGMKAAAAKRGITPEQVLAEISGKAALRRIVSASDISEAVLFLSSERAKNITGQDLVVDGGWSL